MSLETLKMVGVGILGLGAMVTLFILMKRYFEGRKAQEQNKILINKGKVKDKVFKKYVEDTEGESRRHDKAVNDIFERSDPLGSIRINKLLNEKRKTPGKKT